MIFQGIFICEALLKNDTIIDILATMLYIES